MVRSRINILHLRDSPWVCGPARTIIETGTFINRERFNYYIGGFGTGNGNEIPIVSSAIERGIESIIIKEKNAFDLRSINQIIKFIEKHNIHIIHCHEFRSNIIGLICGKIKHKLVITTLHGWISNNLKGKIYLKLDKLILPFFHHIIVVSEKLRSDVLKCHVRKNRISVIHNALVVDKFVLDRSDSSFKTELGLTKDTILIGNIGRLSPEKAQKDFLLAAHKVLKVYPDVKFAIIGTGPDELMLRNLISDLKINNSIYFTGYRTDMDKIYNSLDLVIQTSYTEGLPNVILESLLLKIPVIATDVGGTPEIVRQNSSGILINPGDIDSLANNIIEYILNPEKYRKFSFEGKKQIEDKFNFIARTNKIENLYEQLMMTRWNK